MADSALFENEYVRIFSGSDGIYIESFKKGFSIQQLPEILQKHPEIGVTNINALRNAVIFAPKKAEKFGELRERINIGITPDELKATVSFNLSDDELSVEKRAVLLKELSAEMSKKGVLSGIRYDELTGSLENGKHYVIAEGIPPIHGEDAIIKMYELKESKPDVDEEGKVDLYELKLINRVNAGDWVGERTDATEGHPGQSVKGNIIKQTKGKLYPLAYDKSTVQEAVENNKTVLYARISGAVHYDKDKISISNHLELAGDVGVGTGNIKFDGYVTVKGTVCDGFTLEATKDIEINGNLGLGNIKSIISTGGSIYIKGGISSKGRSEIRAAENVFTKFADNTAISCGGTAHIGYYCINSTIAAKEVVIDASNGQIIGGSVRAEVKVLAPIVGSEAEKKTIIEVTGFDRAALVEKLDNAFRKISELKTEQQKLKQYLASKEGTGQMNQYQKKDFMDKSEKLYNIREELKLLEEERKNTAEYLKTRGEGEITISRKVFPNCTLLLEKNVMEINAPMSAVTFFLQEGHIKQL